MWLLATYLFILCTEGSSAVKDLCLMSVFDHCKDPGDIVRNFPENIDEMTERCSAYTSYAQCLFDHQTICKLETVKVELVELSLKALHKFCNKSSPLFNVIAQNGKCVKKVLMKASHIDKCFENFQEEKLEEFVETRNIIPTDLERGECYYQTLEISCYASGITQDCGESAKDLFLNVIKESGIMDFVCRESTREAIEFVRKLNMRLIPTKSIEDLITDLENQSEA